MRNIFVMVVAAGVLLGVICAGAVYGLSEARLRAASPGAAFDYPIPDDATSIEHGRRIARTRGCFGCHGQQLEGRDFDDQWDWPERAVAPNLAAYAKSHDAATLERAIRQGISANARGLASMPSFNFVHLSDEDLAALIAFLKSAPVVEKALPNPRLGWRARYDFALRGEMHMAQWADMVPPLRVDADIEPVRARGEYLAMTMCNECHGLDVRGFRLYGVNNPDLAIVAGYSREEFETLLRTGVGAGGRELRLMSLVAPDRFTSLAEDEIDALYLYLRGLPDEPVSQEVFWRSQQ